LWWLCDVHNNLVALSKLILEWVTVHQGGKNVFCCQLDTTRIVAIRKLRPTPNERGGQHLSFGYGAGLGMRCGRSQSVMNFSSCRGKFLSHQENWQKSQVLWEGGYASLPQSVLVLS
jgi:hypothetical protein